MKKFTILLVIVLTTGALMSQSYFPEWAKGIVWYQIFPERFANGDESNDPAADKVFKFRKGEPDNWHVTDWTSSWFAVEDWRKGDYGDVYLRRYGGDLQGIINRLDYLKELGVGGIYLNPVFEAVSLHKYDGASYHHIDVNFGPDPEGDLELMKQENPADPSTWVWTSADKLFLELVKKAHEKGIRIIIDGVFNHTGRDFFAFEDIVKNGKDSEYADWYMVKSFDNPDTEEDEFDYKGWWDIKSLPVLNRDDDNMHPAPKEYIFAATKRWMDPNNDGSYENGIDGWRLDVARELPLGFWKDWSTHVKGINPEAIMIGELWELSPDFVSEDGIFDGLMNYDFSQAVNGFFIAQKKKIKASEFIEKLKVIHDTYPEPALHVMQSLMDSHDTDRLASMIVNPDREFDRDAHGGNTDYSPAKPSEKDYEMQKLIAAFQMTYRGAPMIYYGDEVGMWGADDPHCRKPMVWSDMNYDDEVITEESGFKTGYGTYTVEQNKDLKEFYEKLIAIRSENPVLQKGDIQFIHHNDDTNVFAFMRSYEGERMIAAFNVGEHEDYFSLKCGDSIKESSELITEEAVEIDDKFLIHLPPKSVRIYKFN